MPTKSTFCVVQLPKPPLRAPENARWMHLAHRIRSLRLRSLQIAPEAFASTYEAESQWGLEHTFDRIANPKARHFIALETGDLDSEPASLECDLSAICERNWIGAIVLIGPVEGAVTAQADPVKTLANNGANGTAGPSSSDQKWEASPVEYVLNGVFVEPSARGRGVGKALVDTALGAAKHAENIDHTGASVTVLVNFENEEARKLYEKFGFVVVGEERYSQEPRVLLGEDQVTEKVALKMRSAIA